jgi:hypothetical protein
MPLYSFVGHGGPDTSKWAATAGVAARGGIVGEGEETDAALEP